MSEKQNRPILESWLVSRARECAKVGSFIVPIPINIILPHEFPLIARIRLLIELCPSIFNTSKAGNRPSGRDIKSKAVGVFPGKFPPSKWIRSFHSFVSLHVERISKTSAILDKSYSSLYSICTSRPYRSWELRIATRECRGGFVGLGFGPDVEGWGAVIEHIIRVSRIEKLWRIPGFVSVEFYCIVQLCTGIVLFYHI